MRTFSVLLRALVLTAALSAPFAQVALAGEQEQQAMSQTGTASGGSYTGGGLYNNDAQMSPAVGD